MSTSSVRHSARSSSALQQQSNFLMACWLRLLIVLHSHIRVTKVGKYGMLSPKSFKYATLACNDASKQWRPRYRLFIYDECDRNFVSVNAHVKQCTVHVQTHELTYKCKIAQMHGRERVHHLHASTIARIPCACTCGIRLYEGTKCINVQPKCNGFMDGAMYGNYDIK